MEVMQKRKEEPFTRAESRALESKGHHIQWNLDIVRIYKIPKNACNGYP
jgi:hypothetical protein